MNIPEIVLQGLGCVTTNNSLDLWGDLNKHKIACISLFLSLQSF